MRNPPASRGEAEDGTTGDVNGEETAEKVGPRKRVTQACDQCRVRKEKCDNVKPVCKNCTTQETTCTYEPRTKKRGVPGGYLRVMERLWGLTIRDISGAENAILALFEEENFSERFKGSQHRETSMETWRNSRLWAELERKLPTLDTTEEKGKKRKRDASIPRRSVSPELNQEHILPSVDLREISRVSRGRSLEVQDQTVIDRYRSPSTPKSVLAHFPRALPADTWQLLDIYFSYTHCWLPIVERHDLLRISYQYSARGADTQDLERGSGDHALLWAVVAYATYHRNVMQGFGGALNMTTNEYKYARSLIPAEDGDHEVGHVQALLILCLFNIGLDNWTKAWMLIGQAVRISANLGLDTPTSSKPSKQSRSKHVFLGCFALDTIISAQTKRRPQLVAEDVLHVGFVDEDGVEEWDAWRDALDVRRIACNSPIPGGILSAFNRFIKLLMILSDILQQGHGRSTPRVPEIEILERLMSVGHVLPSPFSPIWEQEKDQSFTTPLPHQYHVHLLYISIVAALHLRVSDNFQIGDHTALEIYGSTMRQVAKLLKHHSQHFGLLIVPPTFGLYLYITGDCAGRDDNVVDDWRHDILHSLCTMENAWPTFKKVQDLFVIDTTPRMETIEHRHLSQPQSQLLSSQIPYGQQSGPHENQLQDQMAKLAEEVQRSYNPATLDSSLTPISLQLQGQSPVMLQPGPSGQTQMGRPSTAQWPLGATSTVDYVGQEVDGDSMFNEFATLDAMEWSQNWDQSLQNLGFNDPLSSNQDFYAFCRSPEPRYPDDLIQQIFAATAPGVNGMDQQSSQQPRGFNGLNLDPNTAAAGMNEMSNINLSRLPICNMVRSADNMFSPPRTIVNPNMITNSSSRDLNVFTNPHVEASQILQALATANDRGGGSM